MKPFLRIAAVLVALANWGALMTGGDLARLASYGWWELLTDLLILVALGLVTAEITIRLARKTLEGGFLDRYAAMAATVWIGGMLYGVVLAWGGVLHDESLGALGLIGTGMVASLWGTVAGGVLGLTEGLVLGLPLAAVLGLFGDKETPSTRPASRGGYGRV